MTNIEETGKNIEEATEKALEQLGVTEDEVDVEILDEGTKGFLGLGQTPAKVRVTLKNKPGVPSKAGAYKPEPKPKAEKEIIMAEEKETPMEAVEETRPEAPAQVSPQEAAEIGREVLQRILDGIGTGGKAGVKKASDSQIVLEMVGGDTAILIGKHGQTIDAIQYLVGVITNRRIGSRVRLVIDAEDYRTRREDALKNQARYLADKVKQSGQEAVLEALHANERRIVHTALADDPDVYTYSEGVEPERYVVISPKK